jgi:transcriptional regulator with XRE-family HTH domain
MEAIAMNMKQFPVIDPIATGKNIIRLRVERGMSVRDLQAYFGFEEPQAIYKWISGKSLPSLDNFVILSRLLHTSIENILVIDGDIPRLGVFLNQRFNDFLSLPPYNRVTRN